MNEPLTTILARAAAIRRDGRVCAFCLVVASRGSTPQEPGALMLVDDAASTFGTIGGGCVEAEVRRAAFGLLASARSAPLRFRLNHDYGWDDGLICGGTLELIVAPPPTPDRLDAVIADINARRATHLDLSIDAASAADASAASGTKAVVQSNYRLHIPPRDRLYIAGAGHVGQAVARLALALEFEVHVFDDRADLIEQHLPAGAIPVVGDIAERLADAPIDESTFCLVVTRGHRHDEQALHAVVGRGAPYVGMIGSRRKVKLIFDDLAAMGVSPEALEQVHAPVGLDIGAVTVEEIGVSIAAQLVEVRRRSARKPVERIAGPDPFEPLRADASGVSECGVNARG
ncbi:MAG: XdhC/CoxI family protein [Phycisphaerales bacterium]